MQKIKCIVFFIGQTVKCGCPTFIMNIREAQDSKRLLHINKNLIDLYHLAHHLSGGVLEAKDIPALMLFLNKLRDSDSVLQPIRCLL